MLSLIVDRFGELLSSQPGAVVPAANVGARRPASTAELPMIALSVTADDARGIGLGRFVRTDPTGDVLGDRYRGSLVLEVFAASLADADRLVRNVQARLQTPSELCRSTGFMLLHPSSLDPAENLNDQSPAASNFSVWRQRISYRFVFEYEETAAPTGGGPIKRVDVDVLQPTESFSVPVA
jgi:hypothetical protein